MRVFVTGPSGHIGSAVVPELLAAGHEVVGLARSEESAAALRKAGVGITVGTLDDVEQLREAAAGADAVIHLAYMHTAPSGVDAATADRRAIAAIGDELEGTGKAFVGTSGTLVLKPGAVGTERDAPDASAPAAGRAAAEELAVGLAARGVRSSVVRLPPTVHSSLDRHGFIPSLIQIAREKGAAAFVADGTNRWPAVHTLDAARLFRLGMEHAPAGSRLHATDDEGVPFRQIAEAIGRRLDLPVVSVPAEEAEAHFGGLSFAVAADNPTSSELTRELLDWRPEQVGLLADLEEAHYFGS